MAISKLVIQFFHAGKISKIEGLLYCPNANYIANMVINVSVDINIATVGNGDKSM